LAGASLKIYVPMSCTVHAVYHQPLTQCIIYVRIHWSCCVLVLMQEWTTGYCKVDLGTQSLHIKNQGYQPSYTTPPCLRVSSS